MILGNLAEHLQRIEPHIDTLQLERIIDLGDHNTLNIDRSTVRRDLDFFSFAISLLAHIHIDHRSGGGY